MDTEGNFDGFLGGARDFSSFVRKKVIAALTVPVVLPLVLPNFMTL